MTFAHYAKDSLPWPLRSQADASHTPHWWSQSLVPAWDGQEPEHSPWWQVAGLYPLPHCVVFTLDPQESGILLTREAPVRIMKHGWTMPHSEWLLLEGAQNMRGPLLLCSGFLCHEKGLWGLGPLLPPGEAVALSFAEQRRREKQVPRHPWQDSRGAMSHGHGWESLTGRWGPIRAKQRAQLLGPVSSLNFSSCRPFNLTWILWIFESSFYKTFIGV